jgi:outer membrane protein assembly factor BamB
VLLGAVCAASVGATRPADKGDPTQRFYPRAVGTSWLWTTTTNGKDTGLAFDQVTERANMLADVVDVVRTRFDDFIGRGTPLEQTTYLQAKGDTLLERGSRSQGEFNRNDPPIPSLRASTRPGGVLTWKGTQGKNTGTATNTFVGLETVEVRGHRFSACRHSRAVTTITAPQQYVDTYDLWMCPKVGPVRSKEHYVGGSNDLRLDRELLAHSGPEGTLRLGDVPPSPAAGDAARPSSGSGGGKLDLSRYAWTDTHNRKLVRPPVTGGGRMLTVNDEAVAVMTDARSGEVLWRQQVADPVVGDPVIAGDLALVADARKTLIALDATSGQVRWRATFPDVVSVGPLVVEGTAVVVTEDHKVRALRLRDGAPTWTSGLAERVNRSLSSDGVHVFVADVSGALAAIRVRDGHSVWDADLSGAPASGPVVVGKHVISADEDGHLSSYRASDGRLEWDVYRDRGLRGQLTAAPDAVVVPLGEDLLQVVDASGGKTRWTTRVPGELVGAAVVVGDDLAAVTETGRLVTYRLSDGSPGAAADLGRGTPQAEVPFGVTTIDGALVVAVQGAVGTPERLLAFPLDGRAAAGKSFSVTSRPLPASPLFGAAGTREAFSFVAVGPGVWHVGPAGDRKLLSGGDIGPFAIPAGELVLTQLGGQLQARRASTGDVAWEAPMAEPQPGTLPAVVGDQVVTPLRGIGMASYDVSTGTPRWVLPIPAGKDVGTTYPLEIPGGGGDVLYAAGPLLRISTATGRAVWSGPDVIALAGVAADEDMGYVAGFAADTGVLIAVDLDTGAEVWRTPINVGSLQPPVLAGGMVAVIDGASTLRAFDATTGAPRWEVPIGGSPSGPPVAMDDAFVVYTAGDTELLVRENSRVAAYSSAEGRLLARWQPTGADVGFASFSRLDDKTLFVGGSATTPVAHLLTLVDP